MFVNGVCSCTGSGFEPSPDPRSKIEFLIWPPSINGRHSINHSGKQGVSENEKLTGLKEDYSKSGI